MGEIEPPGDDEGLSTVLVRRAHGLAQSPVERSQPAAGIDPAIAGVLTYRSKEPDAGPHVRFCERRGGAIPTPTRRRRPTIVSAPAAASPELLDRPRRRTFTGQDKLRILGEVERAAGVPGGIGAIMRREGLYSSALSDWRRQRDAGAFEALSPAKRGPKVAEPNPLAAELAQSLRDNSRLKQRLERAEAIVEIQKKVAALLGLPISSDGEP
jgi:transposase